MNDSILLIKTTDSKGLIYKVSQVLFENKLNIEQNAEYVDPQTHKFFMRTHIRGEVDQRKLLTELSEVLPQQTHTELFTKKKKNIVILATKELHVLGDLLIRHQSGELDVNIQAVISNHDDLKDIVSKFDIPFHSISAENIEREEHEKMIIETIDQYENDIIVLAKYMRILTPSFVRRYPNKVLNIHHSFLPAFIGANPYKQAFERGVKIIGATAHIVTNDLDEGPIISQDVVNVDHTYSWQMMRKSGRNVEKVVLSNALDLLLEDRVIVESGKTIIL